MISINLKAPLEKMDSKNKFSMNQKTSTFKFETEPYLVQKVNYYEEKINQTNFEPLLNNILSIYLSQMTGFKTLKNSHYELIKTVVDFEKSRGDENLKSLASIFQNYANTIIFLIKFIFTSLFSVLKSFGFSNLKKKIPKILRNILFLVALSFCFSCLYTMLQVLCDYQSSHFYKNLVSKPEFTKLTAIQRNSRIGFNLLFPFPRNRLISVYKYYVQYFIDLFSKYFMFGVRTTLKSLGTSFSYYKLISDV